VEEGSNGCFDPEPGGGNDTLVLYSGVTMPARQVRLSLSFSLSLTLSLSTDLLDLQLRSWTRSAFTRPSHVLLLQPSQAATDVDDYQLQFPILA
jgi:hypothetical protein